MAIDIKVTDGIDSSIASKLQSIATGAGSAGKAVDELLKRLNSLDATKLKAVGKAAIDASKVEVNTARASYYAAKEKVELANLKTAQARTAKADTDRYNKAAADSQKLATQRSLDTERVVQAKMTSASAAAKASSAQAESLTRQAAAKVKTQYQNQLLQYTGNWAAQDNKQRNTKTEIGQANLGVAQARQDSILNQTLLTQQRLNTEVARGAKESANAAVATQRLTTETIRTSTAATAGATAQQRLATASAATASAQARAAAAIASANNRLSGIRSSSTAAASGIIKVSSAMQQLDASASFLRSDGLRWSKVLWALSGATLTAGAIVQAADAYTLLQNRLTVVAESQESVNTLTKEMFNIARDSRTPVADVAKGYVRFDLAMKEMGRTQKETVVLTTTVNKALQMSGATAGETTSAMLQLSQAFNKGKLDGDEFRSVMENAPLIANALAKELNVTRGELLKLAPAGKLTVDQLTKAILNSSESINQMFDKFKFTIAQSFVILRNEMTSFFGELDKQVGFTQAISYAIVGLADNLDKVLFAVLAVTPALALFVGSKMLAGVGMLTSFLFTTATAVGSIRSPITVVSVGLAAMLRQGVATGTTLVRMFTAPTSAAIGFQLAVVRSAAGVLALGAAAARAGTMMMAAFSFGNIFLVIGTLIAAAIAFGDAIEMAGEKSFTMRDYVITAFSGIWDFTKYVFESIYDLVADVFGKSGTESMTFGEKVLSTFETIVMFSAAMVDSLQHVFNTMWNIFKLGVAAVADGIKAVVGLVVNSVVSLVNGAIDGMNSLTRAANSILSFTGADKLFGQFGQIGKLAGMSMNSSIEAELNSGKWGMNTDVMDAASTALSRTREGASQRGANNRKEGALRAADAAKMAKATAAQKAADAAKSKADKGKKGGKSDAERRSTIIEKAMLAEQKAIDVARQYGDERERVATIEAVNNKLKEKHFKELLPAEKQALSALVDQKLEAERVGSAMQSMYEEAMNPLREYAAGQKAVDRLLNDGILTSGRAASITERLSDSYAEATDALYAMNKALKDQQLIQGKFGVDAEITTNVQDAKDNAKSKGLELTPDQIASVESMTRKIYDMRSAQEAANSVWQETHGAQEELSYTMQAVAQGYEKGSLAASEYTRQMSGLWAQQGAMIEKMYGLQDPTEPMRRGLYQLVADMPAIGQGMADALQSTLGNAIDNIASTMTDMIMNFDAYAESVSDALGKPASTLDVLRYALSDIIKQIGTELIGAVIKLGIQWAIQAALGNAMQTSMAATTIATQTATATAVNAAWTPAAVSASIATLGSAAVTGLASYATAQLSGRAMSVLPAFKDGGEIIGAGTGRSDSILARVSTGEHVVKADAAARNRPLLNAMNSGQDIATGTVDNSVHISVVMNSDGSSSTDEKNATAMAKNIAGMVKLEVTKTLSGMSRQGQPMYQK